MNSNSYQTANRLLKRLLDHIQTKIYLTKIQYFSSKEASKFLFFQFNFGNTQYFFQKDKKLHRCISDTPHYYVAKQSITGDGEVNEEAKNEYIEYLKYSWPSHGLDINESNLESKYRSYLEFIDIIASHGELKEPILLTQIPWRQGYYVVDGNHRCTIASVLGFPIPAKILDFQLVFDRFMRVEEFHGTINKNMPYQSIYIDRHIVRKGCRDDIYDRLDLLPGELLKQKTVLDVGCNIGMNAIGAFKFGARKVLGLEKSKRLVNFATRFAVLDECYPDVKFRQFDMDIDLLPKEEKFDVAFMSSDYQHQKGSHELVKIITKNVVEAVVFEGHPNTKLSDYKDFLNGVHFSKIEKIADLATSVFDRKLSRPLWILYK